MKVLAWLLVFAVGPVAAAGAQLTPERIPVVAIDVRGFYTGLGRDPVTAANLDVVPTDLPSRALGGVAGIHIYPLRFQRLAVGIGGEALLASAKAQTVDDDGIALSPEVKQELRSLAISVSLNFGKRNGWSYVSAGMGPLQFGSFVTELKPSVDPPAQNTINLGGGARWFATGHVAFAFDIRFYQTRPINPENGYAQRQRSQLLVMSAGVAFR